jgi:hypothetical protein
MTKQQTIHHDTTGWVMQVWIAFAASLFACGWGVANLPGQELDRAFLAIGFLFCVFSAFTLAKMMRDNRHEKIDTGHWVLTVWAGFIAAIVLTGWGLWRMPLANSVFTLAKTIRDRFDAEQSQCVVEADPETVTQRQLRS